MATEEQIRAAMPHARRYATWRFNRRKNKDITLEDYISHAYEGIYRGIDAYIPEKSHDKTPHTYMMWCINNQINVLERKQRAKIRSIDSDTSSLEEEHHIDEDGMGVPLLDLLPITYDDDLRDREYDVLSILEFAEDDIDFVIVDGLLCHKTLEAIGDSVGVSKQAIHARIKAMRKRIQRGMCCYGNDETNN